MASHPPLARLYRGDSSPTLRLQGYTPHSLGDGNGTMPVRPRSRAATSGGNSQGCRDKRKTAMIPFWENPLRRGTLDQAPPWRLRQVPFPSPCPFVTSVSDVEPNDAVWCWPTPTRPNRFCGQRILAQWELGCERIALDRT